MTHEVELSRAYFRSVVLGQSIAFGLTVSGVILAALGAAGLVDVQLKLGPLDGWMKNSSPGLVLIFMGIGLMAYYKPKIKTSFRGPAPVRTKQIESQSNIPSPNKEELVAIIDAVLRPAHQSNVNLQILSERIAEVVLRYLQVHQIYKGHFQSLADSIEKTTELKGTIPPQTMKPGPNS